MLGASNRTAVKTLLGRWLYYCRRGECRKLNGDYKIDHTNQRVGGLSRRQCKEVYVRHARSMVVLVPTHALPRRIKMHALPRLLMTWHALPKPVITLHASCVVFLVANIMINPKELSSSENDTSVGYFSECVMCDIDRAARLLQ